MKRMVASMRKQFVNEFIDWMVEHGIKVCGAPFETDGIWNVVYMPIGREQNRKCEMYISYRCYIDLM
jgi:hypothetical protein